MSEVKLLPCPFCGGEVTMHEDVVDALRYSYTFQCDNCMIYGVYQYCNDKDGAIKAWNTRKPMDDIVERLEERTDFLKNCTKYGNKNIEQMRESYSTMMMYEVASLVEDIIDIVKGGLK